MTADDDEVTGERPALGAESREAWTVWLASDDDRGVEVVMPPVGDWRGLRYRKDRPQHEWVGGLYVGSDPECDAVIDELEGFHVHCYALGHHMYTEVIAGVAHELPSMTAMHPGDSTRAEIRFGGWRFGMPARVTADPEVVAAMAIARDARLEGRHAESAAILARVGLVHRERGPELTIPSRLVAARNVLRVRVVSADGAAVVHVLGSIERLRDGISIGAGGSCDVRVPAAGANRIAITAHREDLTVDVLAGEVVLHGSYRQRHAFQSRSRWNRMRLGDAIVQLCRWPARGEVEI